MNKIKFAARSLAYSWKLVLESSKGMIFLYFALSMLAAAFPLAKTFLMKHILNTLMSSAADIKIILILIAAYGISTVAGWGANSAKALSKSTVNKKFCHLYETKLSQKLALLPMEFIDSSEGKDTVEEVRYAQHAALCQFFYFVDIIPIVYTFAVAFYTLARFSLGFSLMFLAFTLPSIAFNEYYERKTNEFRKKHAPDLRKLNYYRWMLTDAWPAKDVRMYDLTDDIKTRYEEEKSLYISENKKLGKKILSGSLLIELFCKTGSLIFTAYVIYKAVLGDIGIGDVTLYIGFAADGSVSFYGVTWRLTYMFTVAAEFMEKIFGFFALPSEKIGGTRKMEEFCSITFDNVYFKYPHTEKYVLSGASFTLKKGEKLSVVGINGSGKSTLIKLMLGLYTVDSGEILINGHPMGEYDIRDVRALFSVLFQSFVKYPLTLRENVALSSIGRMENDREIEEVLRKCGIYGDLEPKLEKGLDSYMTRNFDDKGIALSKGQWQKIALSRAYFKNAPIIVFDEPSSALDAEAEDRIFRHFEDASDGKTGIMISHRISSARMADKIIVLDGGRITEQGTHSELIALNGLYAKLYKLQEEKYTAKEAV